MTRLALFLLIFSFFSPVVPAQEKEKKRFALYATLLEGTPVQLADGSKWEMDKGDTFPAVMYKKEHTEIILQLAGTSFQIKVSQVKIFDESELTEAQLANYRNNVTNYLESKARKMKAEMAK